MTVTVSTVDRMYQEAVSLRDACALILAETDRGTPDRVFVSMGPPVADGECDLLAVHVETIGEESTSPLNPIPGIGVRVKENHRQNLVSFVVTVYRCILAPNDAAALSENEENAAARIVMQDGWALWCGISTLIRRDLLLPDAGIWHFDTGNVVQPMGGVAGWTMRIRPALGGIPDDDWLGS